MYVCISYDDAFALVWTKGKLHGLNASEPVPQSLSEAAVRRQGHQIKWGMGWGGFGRGEIIWRTDDGVLVGGTDPRMDGTVAVW